MIDELRRGIMELLLARCPESVPLRDLAGQLGVTGTAFPQLTDPGEPCVLCGLCVRVCREVLGVSAISFVNRGMQRRVDSPFSLGAENCLGCGACAAVCPTGAIRLEQYGDTLQVLPFKSAVPVGRCIACRKPIAPVPLLALVQARALLPLITGMLCPQCRASRRAEILAAVTTERLHGHSKNHPAREPVLEAPVGAGFPMSLGKGHEKIDSEDRFHSPLDQPDGGCDNQPPCLPGQP
jgi:formate hydrogenlyase subunit 6/NADH:ubiquinone oxidoreductase subunit I